VGGKGGVRKWGGEWKPQTRLKKTKHNNKAKNRPVEKKKVSEKGRFSLGSKGESRLPGLEQHLDELGGTHG